MKLTGIPDPADRERLWRAAVLRCPWCAALVLADDADEHGAAHRNHDAEHDKPGRL